MARGGNHGLAGGAVRLFGLKSAAPSPQGVVARRAFLVVNAGQADSSPRGATMIISDFGGRGGLGGLAWNPNAPVNCGASELAME